MSKGKHNIVTAMFDVKPVNESGGVDVERVSGTEPVINLGRKIRIGKTGRPAFQNSIKNKVSLLRQSFAQGYGTAKQGFGGQASIKYKKPDPVIEEPEIQNTKYEILNTEFNPAEELEKYLNEDVGSEVELASFGVEVVENVSARPRHRHRISYPVSSIKYEEQNSDTKYEIQDTKYEDLGESYDVALAQINQKISPVYDENVFVGEPERSDVADWWQEREITNYHPPVGEPITNEALTPKSQKPKFKLPKISLPSISLPRVSFPKFRLLGSRILNTKYKILSLGLVVLSFGLFVEFGISLKDKIIQGSNSAVRNLEDAGTNIKSFNFAAASTNFSQAYSDFTTAGDNLNFMGATLGSIIADLPGGSKLKSARNLVEAGKLMADAGQSMTQAMDELAKTGLIFDPTSSGASIGNISEQLRMALLVSQKNIKEATKLLEGVKADTIPEDKRADFEEFKSKLPVFEKLVDDAVDYSRFLEDFIGTSGTKKYMLLFQNPSELRPTGGFPGTYGIATFESGRLKEFYVDDIYNPDGQIKELYVPPLQLQHITPTWGARDANWFIDFPLSARKVMEFYKKGSGQDVDGVITFSPLVVSRMLEILGPIEMEQYGLTLTADNFLPTVQEEVEYLADRTQPKQILMDLAPLMLEKVYTADSDQWMEIFDILVSNVDSKDMLMYFRDLRLQDFSVSKGFSGEVVRTQGDYLMVNFTNIKGSKTDLVMDSDLKVDTIFEGNDIRHRVVITRAHNGGKSQYGFYNKQSPTYVRVLVPENAQFLGISGNSKPNFKPLIDYSKMPDFKRDEDLVRFEEKGFLDSETGVTIYEEAGKREYGFWMIIDPGQTKSIELEYRVSQAATGKDYEFYLQKQPGLEFRNLTLNLFSGALEINESSLDLNKEDGKYLFTGKLNRDLPLKVIFK